jgi:glycerophosphoryl diester phosphodiesterase
MRRSLANIVCAAAAATLIMGPLARAFDLEGHRGARGLAPENTLPAFAAAMRIGVTTLELDIGMSKDDVVVISHDSFLNPDHTRSPDGNFLQGRGPAIRALTLAELKRYDVGRLKPGSSYAASFPEQEAMDGIAIPTLAELFELVRAANADHIRFNIETKLTPASAADTPDPETFAAALASAVREAKLVERVSIQSFDWRTLVAMRRIAPEIERVCLTIDGGPGDTLHRGESAASTWTAGFNVDAYDGSVPRLVAAAQCAAWSPLFHNLSPDSFAQAKALGLSVIPWTVNDRAQMQQLIALGVDGIITDYPNRLRTLMAENGMPLPRFVPVH